MSMKARRRVPTHYVKISLKKDFVETKNTEVDECESRRGSTARLLLDPDRLQGQTLKCLHRLNKNEDKKDWRS
jgi:hypothetical protein